MIVMGIDPGPEESGYCRIDWEDGAFRIIEAGKVENATVRSWLLQMTGLVAIEGIQSFGQVIGRSTIETCYEIGRFIQIAGAACQDLAVINRPVYARWFADGAKKVNDSVLRQALILRYGGDKKGEPLHLLKGSTDKRSAFAVAAYAMETGVFE